MSTPAVRAALEALRELLVWADRHSPIPCTARGGPPYSLEGEVVPA